MTAKVTIVDESRESQSYDDYEPYYIRKEKLNPHSEFNEDSLRDYMWHRWGIK